MSARVTMRDVAQLAGVSQRTVSNVVTGSVPVAARTRETVLLAIEQLRYRPHAAARRLRGGRTGVVALAVPAISEPYFAALAGIIQSRAEESGLTLLIDQTGGSADRERLVLDGYHSDLIDGLILNPIGLSADDLARRNVDVPMVLLGESVETSAILHVSVDNVAAATDAVQYLLKLGHRRVVALGAPGPQTPNGPSARRYRGYAEAMGAAGVVVGPGQVIETDVWSRASGYGFAQQIADLRPAADAVFCFDDVLALGLIRGLTELGVRVPADIAVLGWDDIEEARFSTPSLTSISPDTRAIADIAVRGLLQQPGDGPGRIHVGYKLEVRESTGQPR